MMSLNHDRIDIAYRMSYRKSYFCFLAALWVSCFLGAENCITISTGANKDTVFKNDFRTKARTAVLLTDLKKYDSNSYSIGFVYFPTYLYYSGIPSLLQRKGNYKRVPRNANILDTDLVGIDFRDPNVVRRKIYSLDSNPEKGSDYYILHTVKMEEIGSIFWNILSILTATIVPFVQNKEQAMTLVYIPPKGNLKIFRDECKGYKLHSILLYLPFQDLKSDWEWGVYCTFEFMNESLVNSKPDLKSPTDSEKSIGHQKIARIWKKISGNKFLIRPTGIASLRLGQKLFLDRNSENPIVITEVLFSHAEVSIPEGMNVDKNAFLYTE